MCLIQLPKEVVETSVQTSPIQTYYSRWTQEERDRDRRNMRSNLPSRQRHLHLQGVCKARESADAFFMISDVHIRGCLVTLPFGQAAVAVVEPTRKMMTDDGIGEA